MQIVQRCTITQRSLFTERCCKQHSASFEVVGIPSLRNDANGEQLVLKYKGGGEQKVVVGSDAVIVRVMPGDKAELVPGAKIWAVAPKGPDGSLTAVALYVGRDGLQPPM